eukprot:scaffold1439_cov78-Phaeocystis_antarctica.AAC.1
MARAQHGAHILCISHELLGEIVVEDATKTLTNSSGQHLGQEIVDTQGVSFMWPAQVSQSILHWHPPLSQLALAASSPVPAPPPA